MYKAVNNTFKFDNYYNKAEVIADDLKEMIISQQLSDKLPSESSLAVQYSVNIKTVNKAISRLIDSGYAYRRRGIGTFACDSTRKTEDEYSEGTVALFMPSHGHLYEDLYNSLTKALKVNHIYPILMNSDSSLTLPESRNLIDQAIRFKCKSLIIGYLSASCFDYKYLKGKREAFDRVGLINCQAESDIEALRLSTDPHAGSYRATMHLLEQGCRRILFVDHADGRFLEKNMIVENVFYSGYQHALREYEIEEEFTFGESNDYNTNVKKLEKILIEHQPDGVFCVQDDRAMRVVKAAANVGLNVPEDLLIVGYYNTPWSRLSVPALTSVSTCEERIAHLICEKFKERVFSPEKIIIKPEVVVRESTALKRKL